MFLSPLVYRMLYSYNVTLSSLLLGACSLPLAACSLALAPGASASGQSGSEHFPILIY